MSCDATERILACQHVADCVVRVRGHRAVGIRDRCLMVSAVVGVLRLAAQGVNRRQHIPHRIVVRGGDSVQGVSHRDQTIHLVVGKRRASSLGIDPCLLVVRAVVLIGGRIPGRVRDRLESITAVIVVMRGMTKFVGERLGLLAPLGVVGVGTSASESICRLNEPVA